MTKSESSLRRVIVYTDGACRGNPGLGAYAAILTCDGYEKEIVEVVEDTTNNRMELLAAIAGLEALKESCQVRVVSDSQYVCRGMTEWIHGWKRKGWKRKKNADVANRDLWERLDAVSSKHEAEWVWVKGHAGHEFNERCDQLANEAMDAFLASGGA